MGKQTHLNLSYGQMITCNAEALCGAEIFEVIKNPLNFTSNKHFLAFIIPKSLRLVL